MLLNVGILIRILSILYSLPQNVFMKVLDIYLLPIESIVA